jgi:peptide/nickel transport system permease protein
VSTPLVPQHADAVDARAAPLAPITAVDAERDDREDRFGSWMLIVGIALIAIVVVLSAAAPLLTASGPREITLSGPLEPPGGSHLLGTDRNGIDVWSRLLAATRTDLGIAVIAVCFAVLVGTILGAVVGFVGGWLDEATMRLLDIVQAFPTFVFALTVAAIVGPGRVNLMVVIAAVNAPAYARLVRAEVRTVRAQPYIDAASISGSPRWKILLTHVVPNSLTPVRVLAPLNCGWAMLTLAGLSFLGLGIPVLEPEWGAMISIGANDAVAGRWWTSVPPGLALVVCVFGFSLIGEGLQQRADRIVS